MRQIKMPPVFIVEIVFVRRWGITEVEFPVMIEKLFALNGRLGLCIRYNAQQGK
jgi:hypothetical protein